MSGRLSNAETFVVDIRYHFDRRWTESELGQALVGGVEILDHEIELGLAARNFTLGNDDEMGPAPELEDGDARPLIYGSHADREHELGRFRQSIALEGDVPHPDRRPKILSHPTFFRVVAAFFTVVFWRVVAVFLRVVVTLAETAAALPGSSKATSRLGACAR